MTSSCRGAGGDDAADATTEYLMAHGARQQQQQQRHRRDFVGGQSTALDFGLGGYFGGINDIGVGDGRHNIIEQLHHHQQQQQQQQIQPLGYNFPGSGDIIPGAMGPADRKPLAAHQPATPGPFNYSDHHHQQFPFGGAGPRDLTQFSPIMFGPPRHLFGLPTAQRSQQLRQYHNGLAQMTSPMSSGGAFYDVRMPIGGIPNFGCALPAFNLSPPDRVAMDPSDNVNASAVVVATSVEPPPPRPTTTTLSRRPKRCDRKPIPDSQKDDRYYERRGKNNAAAKKSRDTRKQRVTAATAMLDKLMPRIEAMDAVADWYRRAVERLETVLRMSTAEMHERMRLMQMHPAGMPLPFDAPPPPGETGSSAAASAAGRRAARTTDPAAGAIMDTDDGGEPIEMRKRLLL